MSNAMNPEDLDRMVAQYVGTALWSTNDESDDSGGEPMDSNYGADDIAEDSLATMRADCKRFGEANAEQIERWAGNGNAWEQAGHDLWLTRNGHGTGFWDRGVGDWPNDGLDLHAASNAFGECDLYVGDDGKVYLS